KTCLKYLDIGCREKGKTIESSERRISLLVNGFPIFIDLSPDAKTTEGNNLVVHCGVVGGETYEAVISKTDPDAEIVLRTPGKEYPKHEPATATLHDVIAPEEITKAAKDEPSFTTPDLAAMDPGDENWVKIEDVAAYMAKTTKSGENMLKLLMSAAGGNDIQSVLDSSPGNRTEAKAQLEELAHKIFPESARSVVENTMNAVNAVLLDKTAPKRVDVRLEDKYMEINDNGIGMSLVDIFYCYLTPVRTGWGTLGDTNARFGSGSLSTLKYLVKASDRLIVSTSNGVDSYDVHFKRSAEGIKLKIVPSSRTTKGTTIKVRSDSFRADAAEEILHKSLSANLDAEIHVHRDGKVYALNDIKGYRITGDKETARFAVKGDIKKGACRVAMTVLGETIINIGVISKREVDLVQCRNRELWEDLGRYGWIIPIGNDMALVKATEDEYRRGMWGVRPEDMSGLVKMLESSKDLSHGKDIPEVIVELPKKVKLNLKRGRTGVIFNAETSGALDVMIDKAMQGDDGPELLSAIYPALERFEKVFRAQDRGMRNLTQRTRKALIRNIDPGSLYLPNNDTELRKVSVKDKRMRYLHPKLITEELLDASWGDRRYRDVDSGNLCFMAEINDPLDKDRLAVSSGGIVIFKEKKFPKTPLGKELLGNYLGRAYNAYLRFRHPGEEEEIVKGALSEGDRKLIQKHLAKMDMRYARSVGDKKNPLTQEMCEKFFSAIFDEEPRSVRIEFIDGVFENMHRSSNEKGLFECLVEADFISDRLPVLVPLIRSILLGRLEGAPKVAHMGYLSQILEIDNIYKEDPDMARNMSSALRKALPVFYENLEQGGVEEAVDLVGFLVKTANSGESGAFKAMLADDKCMKELAEILAVSAGTVSSSGGYLLRCFSQNNMYCENKALTYLGPSLAPAVEYFHSLTDDDPKLAAEKFFDFIEFVYIFTEDHLNPAHAERLKADPDFGRRALLAWSDKRMGWASADDITYRKRISPALRASWNEIRETEYLGNRDMRPYYEFVSKGSNDKKISLGRGISLDKKADGAGVIETIRYKLSQILAEQAEGERGEKGFQEELVWLRMIGSKKFDDEVIELERRKIQQAALFLTTHDQYLWVREIFQNITDEASRRGIPLGERETFLELMASDDDELVSRIGSAMNIKLSAIDDYLFVPFKSGKREEKVLEGADKLTGEHGVGFFSMFSGNPEVNIWSYEEDGYSICLNIKPVLNDEGEMIDGECELKVMKSEEHKGAFFERVSSYEPSALEPEFVSARAETLAGFMDEDKMRMYVQGRKINKPKHLLWEHDSKGPLGTIGCYKAETETTVFQDGYYVQDISEHFADYISDTVREPLEKEGYAIRISGDITLIADRTDINDRDLVLGEKGLGHMIRTVTAGAGLELFKRGKGDFLAYHLAKTAGPYFHDGPRERTWKDDEKNALALLNDEKVDFSRYGKSDERILIRAPVVDIGSEKLDSFEVFCRFVDKETPPDRKITIEMIPEILRPFFIHAESIWKSLYLPPERPEGSHGSYSDWEPDKTEKRRIPNTNIHPDSVPGEFDAFAAYVDLLSWLTGVLGYEHTGYGYALDPDSFSEIEDRHSHSVYHNLNDLERADEDKGVKGLSRLLKGEMTKTQEAKYLEGLISWDIIYRQEKLPPARSAFGWSGGREKRDETESRRYAFFKTAEIEKYIEDMKKRYKGEIGDIADFLNYLDSCNGKGDYVPKIPSRQDIYRTEREQEEREHPRKWQTVDELEETAAEHRPDPAIAAEIADLRKESELVDAILNTAASMMTMSGKKVVLAFNEELGWCINNGKVKELIELLAKVKDKKSLGIFLGDLVIVPAYHYGARVTDDTGTLERRLAAMGIEDMDDTDRYAIFTFDPLKMLAEEPNEYSAVRNVTIQEAQSFDRDVDYYPLFEIVAITLYSAQYYLHVDDIAAILEDKGLTGHEFNLPLRSMSDQHYFLSFYVYPPMDDEAVEDISRNDRIIKALDSAA
ncbi:MAG: hypothetical protein HQL30_11290, partial [Candidatus Omnitrophica bacterium]|nr:hypothetical protein [Candidatus Omnitrophota bacterium]